jgi:hypothetical protein
VQRNEQWEHGCRAVRWVTVGVALAFILAGCRPEPAELTEQDGVEIYTAVIRQLVGPDDTFGGTLEKPVIYIVRRTDDAVGDPSSPGSGLVSLPETAQAGIAAALTDLPSQVIWVDRFEDVPLDEGRGSVAGGGVVVRLGTIHVESSGKVQVPGSVYIANLAAGGTTYVLEHQRGGWVITGTTGPAWIS